ncbi:Tex family protein [Orenia metallireducens]|uniref:Tex family protein n=1 Tax=Orenia metallireducens TaxID=1413210 RepID=UPI000BE34B07|nr:Tex family protein [Orenia metallireducens]
MIGGSQLSFNIEKQLAKELNLKVGQVKRTINLFDKGNTIPFIARYRKEVTDSLDEEQLRGLAERLDYLRRLEERKEEVINSIDKQEKLTEDLEIKIRQASQLQELEDLYRPYKQKRKTRATKAKERGLEPLAELFLKQELILGDVKDLAKEYVDPAKELESIEEVLQGVRDIIAEYIADDPYSRRTARKLTFEYGSLVSEAKVEERTDYEVYYDYQEGIKKVRPHSTLAINRGEKEDVLRVKVATIDESIIDKLKQNFILEESIFTKEIEEAIIDAYNRLVAPAIEREVRSHLTELAEEHAINVFAKNLRNLLLQPPLSKVRVMAIDPGFRTGSKVSTLDEFGKFISYDTIYPHPPQKRWDEAKEKLSALVKKHDIDIIAIGNGTASRETESLVVELIGELSRDLKYIIVNEAGASVYSASKLAVKEFPDLDVSIRGAISIGRRLQDPLAELVKIAPKHLGVGMYQHDVTESSLEESLKDVVESVVNYVGVDLNTASSALLEYVAGINSNVAKNIIKYREENGKFKSRDELKDVYRLGPKTFTQAAGFLKIREGNNPLDQTFIHPESYHIAEKLLHRLDFELEDLSKKEVLKSLQDKIKSLDLNDLVEELEVGLPTLKDIVSSLAKPDRDPREELPKPIFRTDVLKFEDLEVGMVLQGTIRNVVDFGAFVDIGVKQDGLVHISQLSDKYIKNPLDVVAVGDIVSVSILEIDSQRGRISLTMNF